MAARSSMTNLILRWRRMVDDVGTVVFTDDRAQQILDDHRWEFYQEELTQQPLYIQGTVTYTLYHSQHRNLEGTATAAAFRLYNTFGTAITSGFTVDEQRGLFTFSADQAGSVRYFDGRSYDLNGAAASGWRERSGLQSGAYDFKVEGRSYNRSQYFTHCIKMAEYYQALQANQGSGSDYSNTIERSDML